MMTFPTEWKYHPFMFQSPPTRWWELRMESEMWNHRMELFYMIRGMGFFFLGSSTGPRIHCLIESGWEGFSQPIKKPKLPNVQ
jgi:hypothetical protein